VELPRTGDVLLEKYRLGRLLGQRVAVKLIRPEFATQSDAVTRFLNEARAAARIENDHVARCPLDGGFMAPGTPCSSSADCCGAPCANNQCLGSFCISRQGQCQETHDCCGGFECIKEPFTSTGTCGGAVLADGGIVDAGRSSCYFYGQACTSEEDCCHGVPCTVGRRRWPL
jgi:hypothetical protein